MRWNWVGKANLHVVVGPGRRAQSAAGNAADWSNSATDAPALLTLSVSGSV